jgi:CTP:molybdopterin cytidylyltransferase MocA
MKAVILAAGKGTRMRDLTRELPKPMLRVRGRPILEHIVAGLASTGIDRICIITGWQAEVVENHFQDGSAWGTRIQYARQTVQDGTGKAPELAREFVGNDPFLLTYGDILVRPETYTRMQQRFAEGRFAGLLTVTEGEDVSQGGLNFFDDQFCLRRLVEKCHRRIQRRVVSTRKPKPPKSPPPDNATSTPPSVPSPRPLAKGSIMRLGDARAQVKIDVIPTGALGLGSRPGLGGIPRGRVVEIFGPESSGKTTLMLHVIANAQKAGRPGRLHRRRARPRPGLRQTARGEPRRSPGLQPDSGEEALTICETLARSNALDVIVIDSVAALVPRSSSRGRWAWPPWACRPGS